MQLHRLVETFDAKASRCRSLGELSGLLDAAVPDLGFNRFSLIHWLWFRAPDARLIRLDNYGDYGEEFIARRDYLHDPVMLASQRASRAFPWTGMGGLANLGRRQNDIMKEARRHGLVQGWTLPVSVPGEPAGSCSFATSANELPSRWHCRSAALIGASAFHEARRLCGFPKRGLELPVLSPRKQEILRLGSLGKTDPEIAMILGLSRTTIETYMSQLRQTLNVCTRTQLCVMALRLGLIPFEDAIS